jgi:hypothetical protein
MRHLAVAALGAAACIVSVAAPAAAEVVVNVSKSTQRMAVWVDGLPRYNWAVSTGRRGYGTPSGVYQPQRLERFWRSRKYGNTPMPYSVFYYKGYAVHGTKEVKQLGRAASHGCVRLHPDNAAALFALVKGYGNGNTRIAVFDGPLPAIAPPKSEPLVAESSPVPESVVSLAMPVAVEKSVAAEKPAPAEKSARLSEAVKAPARTAFVQASARVKAEAGFRW